MTLDWGVHTAQRLLDARNGKPAPIKLAWLDMTREEKRALRHAGLDANDVRTLRPEALVHATDEVIDHERAEYLVLLAGLLGHALHPSPARQLLCLGIRHFEDLATFTADDLWQRMLDGRAHNAMFSYDFFCALQHVAGPPPHDLDLANYKSWARRREEGALDPGLDYWRYVHGRDTPPPEKTRERLVIADLGIKAPLVTATGTTAGLPHFPLDHRHVSSTADRRTVVGHWTWLGKHGAFFRLHELERGMVVEVGRDGYVITELARGLAPLALPEVPEGGVLLATPEHRRYGPLLPALGLDERPYRVERETLATLMTNEPIVQVAAAARLIKVTRG